MKTRCPACGATTSLDALLGHSEASRAFVAAINLVGDLAKPIIQYLGMFRSENRDLTFERASKLLNELAADINANQIKRGHHFHPAPKAAWIWAINTILERRDQGKLQLPFKNHGYLYEVLTSYKPDQHTAPAVKNDLHERTALVVEKSLYEREQELKAHERLKNEPAAVSIADVYAMANAEKPKTLNRTLKNIPPSQVFAHVSQNRRDGETHSACLERLLAEQEQGATP